MKICKYCGSKFADSDVKCISCGAQEFYQVVETDNTKLMTGKAQNVLLMLKKAPQKIKIVIYAFLTLIVVLLGLNLYQFFVPASNQETVTEITDFGFHDIGELATQSAYNKVVLYDKKTVEIMKIKIPGTTKSRIATLDVVVKAGIDFSEIDYTVDDATQTVTVRLPEAKVLSSEVDFDSLIVLDEKLNIFNPTSFEQNNEVYKKVEQEGLNEALKRGLLENALSNAQMLVKTCVLTVLPEYSVSFAPMEEA